MQKPSILVFLLLLAIASPQLRANTFTRFLEQQNQDNGFSGSVLVAKGDQKIFSGGIGLANEVWGIPADAETRYVIASVTKSMTATLVMILAERELIDLNESFESYDISFDADYTAEVTVMDLLLHTSGIPNFNELTGWFDGAFLQEKERKAFLEDLAALPPSVTPGAEYHYSNANYLLLVEVIEAVTKKQFATVLQDELLVPLQMNDTGLIESNVQVVHKLASNYRANPSEKIVNGGAVNLGHFVGSASNYSTVQDLFRFVRGVHTGGLLAPQTRSAMFSLTQPIGWNVADVPLAPESPPSRLITYSGELEGYNSMITYIVDYEICIVILNNNDAGYDGLTQLTRQLLGLLMSS